MKTFMVIMAPQTPTLTQPLVMRSIVTANDILLNRLPKMAMDPPNSLSRAICDRFAGSTSPICFPRPSPTWAWLTAAEVKRQNWFGPCQET